MKQRTWSQKLVTPHSRTTPTPQIPFPANRERKSTLDREISSRRTRKDYGKSSEDALGSSLAGNVEKKIRTSHSRKLHSSAKHPALRSQEGREFMPALARAEGLAMHTNPATEKRRICRFSSTDSASRTMTLPGPVPADVGGAGGTEPQKSVLFCTCRLHDDILKRNTFQALATSGKRG